jgi:hypothetical protein
VTNKQGGIEMTKRIADITLRKAALIALNEAIGPGPNLVDPTELTVQPKDDGFHIVDYITGDFEWWYFDIIDQESGCFLKIVMHIGTDPLKTRIFPQLAISINTPEWSESFSHPYSISELEADDQQCNISIKDELKIWAEFNSYPEYFIKIDIPRFKCNYRFIGDIEGWKPLGKEIHHQIGKKKNSFSWIVPVPKARVEGDFFYKDKNYLIHNAIGYHDHNYIKVDKKHPLYLDDLVIKWYWGKCYADRFMIIFMDIYCRTNRTLSLLVAENNKIIYGANNLMDCSIVSFGYDNIVQAKYPELLIIKSTDKHFHFQAEFEFDKILDRKDLLEGVNPVFKLLIKRLVAKPVYHGILAKVKLKIKDSDLEGYGNFESMVIRDK